MTDDVSVPEQKGEPESKAWNIILSLMMTGVILMIVVVIFGSTYKPNYEAPSDAERAVKARLRDPSSARFGDISTYPFPAGGVVHCGAVNAKNGFGGYGGERRFVHYSKSGRVVIDDGNSVFDGFWADCRYTREEPAT